MGPLEPACHAGEQVQPALVALPMRPDRLPGTLRFRQRHEFPAPPSVRRGARGHRDRGARGGRQRAGAAHAGDTPGLAGPCDGGAHHRLRSARHRARRRLVEPAAPVSAIAGGDQPPLVPRPAPGAGAGAVFRRCRRRARRGPVRQTKVFMTTPHPVSPVLSIVKAHRRGQPVGIYSVCSSHELVLRAALRVAMELDTPLLVEATSNQVDQNGGYTGLRPAAFRAYVEALATALGFPLARLVLGGDHLGPNTWQKLPAEVAMAHARTLIHDYVAAGFHKINLDCSMACADDPQRLDDATVARRSADLAAVAEAAARDAGLPPPIYVIGTEVPVPGGEASLAEGLQVTTPAAAAQTLAIHQQAFDTPQLRDAWQRVIAMVVQPGVDFDHSSVHEYDPAAASALADFLEQQPGLVFEAHSTDYQRETALHAMVRDHFAILKVGPAATFALREGLLALCSIEDELLPAAQASQLM